MADTPAPRTIDDLPTIGDLAKKLDELPEPPEGKKLVTHVHKFKHMYCGLHFAVFSWHEDWEPKVCPECGNGGSFLHWHEEVDDFIFNFVPGGTMMTGVTLSEGAPGPYNDPSCPPDTQAP